jgi:squalene cyclase
MFAELQMDEEVKTCLRLLLECQDPNGEFYGPSAEVHGTKVPSEWHTAQAISALAVTGNRGAPCERACNWLIARQQSNGSWGVSYEPYCSYNTFFTAYSLMALLDAKIGETATSRALKWLRGMQKASGGFGDTGSTLLAVSALQLYHGSAFTMQMPLPLFSRIQAALGNNAIQ